MQRFMVLGLLHDGRARHGYAIAKAYRERGGSAPSGGTFYRDLKRLAADGLIAAESPDDDGDARRAPYRITERGRRAFREWFLATAAPMPTPHEDGLALRLVCLPDVAPREGRGLLAAMSDAIVRRIARLEQDRDDSLAAFPSEGRLERAIRAAMLGRRIRALRGELSFLEELRGTYDAWTAEPGRPADENAGAELPPRSARVVAAMPLSSRTVTLDTRSVADRPARW